MTPSLPYQRDIICHYTGKMLGTVLYCTFSVRNSGAIYPGLSKLLCMCMM